jgi:hypothetical protein
MDLEIGILAPEDDFHARVIQHRIESRHHVPCHIIPGRQLALRGGLSWHSEPDEPAALPTSRGGLVDPAALAALWCRRIPKQQTLPPEADPDYAGHINSECETALLGVLRNAFHGAWVSHPDATDRGDNKLVQLRLARALGLRIPRTLVSQDPARIRAFVAREGEVILKAVRPRGEAAETAIVSPAILGDDAVLSLAPTIYQECIRGTSHLRVLVLGDTCHATRIEAERLDWRLDLSVPFAPVSLSSTLAAQLAAVLRGLDLAMGVFDLKIDEAGEAVFLEVNPQGQFLFVEGLSGQGLADELSDFLVARARHAAASDAPLGAAAGS